MAHSQRSERSPQDTAGPPERWLLVRIPLEFCLRLARCRDAGAHSFVIAHMHDVDGVAVACVLHRFHFACDLQSVAFDRQLEQLATAHDLRHFDLRASYAFTDLQAALHDLADELLFGPDEIVIRPSNGLPTHFQVAIAQDHASRHALRGDGNTNTGLAVDDRE